MANFDFSPFFRSTVGFDRIADLLDDAQRATESDGYPPYNIELTGENTYRITMAVAGVTEKDLTLAAPEHPGGERQGAPAPEDGTQFLHRGIAGRAFERRFSLADYVKVTNASLVNGLLTIDLVREVPEAMKPRTIQIGTGQNGAGQQASAKVQTLDFKAA